MAFQVAILVNTTVPSIINVVDNSNYGDDTHHDGANFADLYRIYYMDKDNNVLYKKSLTSLYGWADEVLSTIPSTAPGIGGSAELYTPGLDKVWKIGIVALSSGNNPGIGDCFVSDDGNQGLLITYTDGVEQTVLGQINPVLGVDSLETWEDVEATLGTLGTKYYAESGYVATTGKLEDTLSKLYYRAMVVNGAINQDPRTLFNDPDWLESAKLYLDSRAIDQLVSDSNADEAQIVLDRSALVISKYGLS